MKKIGVLFILTSVMLLGCNKTSEDTLNIAVAANMQYALKAIAKEFTQIKGIKCNVIVGSSGKLTAQIKEGAPYDIFVSADLKYPNDLYNNSLTTGKPQVYAYGTLVIWTMLSDISPSYNILSDKAIRHVAIPNPKLAPYGAAALESLQKQQLYEGLKEKLVFGENVAQTSQFITTKSAEIGFTSKSIVLSSAMKGKGNWIDVDKTLYSPIAQGAVILKQHNVDHRAEQFYDFLYSIEAKKTLKDFGYLVD